jgi:hypothetical protein
MLLYPRLEEDDRTVLHKDWYFDMSGHKKKLLIRTVDLSVPLKEKGGWVSFLSDVRSLVLGR